MSTGLCEFMFLDIDYSACVCYGIGMFSTQIVKRLTYLLAADVALSFVYAFVPTDLTLVRHLIAWVQLGFMAATMWVSVRAVLKDF